MEIEIFEHEVFGNIRVVMIDGEPWFVGKDVAEALDYSNTKDAISTHVDKDDKRILQRSEIATLERDTQNPVLPANFDLSDFPNRGLTIINEPGLYHLSFSSKLPSAKEFAHWVTHDILPSIRKHGAYITEDVLGQIIASPKFGIQLLTALQEEREQKVALRAKIEADAPKVLLADAVTGSEDWIPVGDLSKLLEQNGYPDIGRTRLFRKLREEGWLMRQRGSDWNMPTQRSVEMGLFGIRESTFAGKDGETHIRRTTYVTGKGQAYFINKYIGRESTG